MSRLLSMIFEYANIIIATLVIMGIAALLALVIAEPNRSDGVLFGALAVLIVIAVVNGFIATLMSARRHLADIRANEIRQTELLRTIAALNVSIDAEAQNALDPKYPTTNM